MTPQLTKPVLGLLLLLLLTAPVQGYEFRSGDEVYVSGRIENDIYMLGSSVNFDGDVVLGDAVAFGQTVTTDGTIDGNLWAFGRRVTINGEIMRSVRAGAQYVTINAQMEGDLTAAAQDIFVVSDAIVGRDCGLAAMEIIIDGTIIGNCDVTADVITISGHIEGDVQIQGNEISITPQAVIEGDLNYDSYERARIAPEAQILGDTKWKKLRRSASQEIDIPIVPPPTGFLWSFLFLCGNLLVGVLLIIFKRDMVLRIVEDMKSRILIHGLLGILLIVIVPIVLVMVAVTVIGLPIAIIGFTLHTLFFFIGKVFVGIALGVGLLSMVSGNRKVSLGWSLLLGMLILALLFKIPVLGWLVYFLAWAIGAGALTFCFFRRKTVVLDEDPPPAMTN